MRKLLLNTILILIPLLSFSQSNKIFVLTDKGKYRVFVDSQDNRMYLNVIEFIKDPIFDIDARRYEVLSLVPDSCCIKYVLGNNQFGYFNHAEKEGCVCEERMDGYKCFTFKQ